MPITHQSVGVKKAAGYLSLEFRGEVKIQTGESGLEETT